MSIQKLKRVMWRLREMNKGNRILHTSMLRKAIMLEIGTDEVTIKRNIQKLKELEWIDQRTRHIFHVEDYDPLQMI